MLSITTLSSSIMYASPSAQKWVANHPAMLTVSLVLTLVSAIGLVCVRKRHPWNIVLLGILNLCMSYIVGIVCLSYSPQIVIQAAVATTVSSFSASILAYALRNKNLTALGNFLFCILIVFVMLAMLRQFIDMGKAMNTVYAGIGAVLFTAYIVFDTWWLLSRASPDDAIIVAVNLYLDVINLFMYALECLNSRE